MQKNYKPLIILLTCVAVLALIAVFVIAGLNEYGKQQRRKEYESVVSSLEKKRADILAEYLSVSDREHATLGTYSALSMVFKGVDKALYDKVYPVFRDSDGANGVLDGIICLSPTEIPGDEGKITLPQFREMLADGWVAAILYDGSEELSGYLDMMKYTFEFLGIPAYDTVLFLDGTYDSSFDPLLMEYGVEYAVHSGGNVYPIVESRAESETVLIPGYIGWNNVNDKGARYIYEYLLTRGGVASFIVGFPGNVSDGYRVDGSVDVTDAHIEGFKRLVLENLLPMYNSGRIIVGDFDSAFWMRRAYLEALAEAEPRIEAKKAELLAEMEKVEKEIISAYYEFIGG